MGRAQTQGHRNGPEGGKGLGDDNPISPSWHFQHHCPELPSWAWHPWLALHLSAHRSPEAPKTRGCRGQVRLTHVLAQWAWPREGLGGVRKKARGQKVLLPLWELASPAGQPLPTATPGGFLAHGRPCPDWPPLSSLIRTQLSPWSLGQRHFWKHRCQWRPPQLQALRDHGHALWKTGQTPKEPSEGHGRQGRSKWHPSSSLFPWLCGCQSDARPTPKGVEGTASLGKFTVCPVHAIPSSS